MAEKGRVLMHDFSSVLTSISVVVPFAVTDNTVNVPVPGYLVGGIGGGGTFAGYFYYPRTQSSYAISGLAQFDQAVQFQTVIYTNGGQRLIPDPTGLVGTTAFQWQYPAPRVRQGAGPGMTIADAGAGLMGAGTYFYVITRTTLGPDGNTNETSVDLAQYASPLTVTIAASHNITLGLLNGFTFAGANADGSTYTTNLYRMSANQPTYLFVANIGANAPYTDTQTDAQIAANPQLVPQRDQPPVSPIPYGVSAGTQNFGALCIHKNRIWTYVIVQTSGTPQVQLWYSNLGRGWEFNQLTQVLLLNSDVTTSQSATFAPFTYSSLYGNEPVALAEVGSLLIAFSRRQTWAIYGDDPTTFVQRMLFNIGCTARHSVTPAVGGAFWLSENGAYFFDGSAPQYDSEAIRGSLKSLSPNGALPSDQSQATGAFSNMTWYLSFPTLNLTYSYFTVTGKWLSIIPYAAAGPAALAYVPAHPSSYGGTDLNEVVAARGGSKIDWWFADFANDLGLPQSCSWAGPVTHGGKPSLEKTYRFITLFAPAQPGTATVTLTIDPGALSSSQYSVTFDLSGTGALSTMGGSPLPFDYAPRHIVSVPAPNVGFSGQLSVVLTGLPGKPAPVLWGVEVWGSAKRTLAIPV